MSSRPDPNVFARRLREARVRVGLPQDKLGVLLGIDEGASSARMSRYESGAIQPPFAMIARIAQVLRVPQAYLFCEDDQLAEVILRFAHLSSVDKTLVLEQLRAISTLDLIAGIRVKK